VGSAWSGLILPSKHQRMTDRTQCPANGQGLTALVALGIIEAVEELHGLDVLELEFNSAAYLHILIEALRLAFADSKSGCLLASHTLVLGATAS
jgi:gamma-glutamyltranspeptidase